MRRYEEGYDIPDFRYEEWLRLNHPEATDPNVEQSTDSVSKVQALSEAATTSDPNLCSSTENEAQFHQHRKAQIESDNWTEKLVCSPVPSA